MARDPKIEERLLRWAQAVTVGDGNGFPAMSVLHPQWQPPTPGQTPTLKVAAGSDVRQTHRAIGELSLRLRNTIVVHYVVRGTIQEQARRLECAPDTVHARIEEAHRRLAAHLAGVFATSTK